MLVVSYNLNGLVMLRYVTEMKSDYTTYKRNVVLRVFSVWRYF